MNHDDSLLQRFQALDRLLQTHQALWQPPPFTCLQLDWERQHPALAQWLRQRSLEQAEADHHQLHRLQAPEPFPTLARQAATLAVVDDLPQCPPPKATARLNVDVPGRKWQQIEAFSRCLQFSQPPRHWLDWCAGKGHLGRYLARDGSALTCLELDARLVAEGQRLSARLNLPARHLRQDVLGAEAAGQLGAELTPVALHACGDLHIRLLQLASAAGCTRLAIAPCCYNRIRSHQYQPLSAPAQASTLQLTREALRLVQCESVTAGHRTRQQRDLSMARRLAFDLLQRELRGSDDYLPVPSLPVAWLNKPFDDYCVELTRLKQLSPPAARDWQVLEAAGWKRLAQVRNLELLRGLFRRPLEVWLLLDRALYLQERGYRVGIGRFCASSVTPRNLLLLAERI